MNFSCLDPRILCRTPQSQPSDLDNLDVDNINWDDFVDPAATESYDDAFNNFDSTPTAVLLIDQIPTDETYPNHIATVVMQKTQTNNAVRGLVKSIQQNAHLINQITLSFDIQWEISSPTKTILTQLAAQDLPNCDVIIACPDVSARLEQMAFDSTASKIRRALVGVLEKLSSHGHNIYFQVEVSTWRLSPSELLEQTGRSDYAYQLNQTNFKEAIREKFGIVES